jgi:hypothetical protein
VSTESMYQHALGEPYTQLPRAVQAFHALQGAHALTGWVQTEAPSSALARLLAWALGAPRRASAGPIRFELFATSDAETWTRHFPLQTMRSTLRLAGAEVHESLGPARLRFQLTASPEGLDMQLMGLRFLGLPCPRWLLPEIVAHETGNGQQLHFEVAATVHFIGRVTAYRGHLDLPVAS